MESGGNLQLSADFEKELIPKKVTAPKREKQPNPNKTWVSIAALLMVLNFVFFIVAIIGFAIIRVSPPN